MTINIKNASKCQRKQKIGKISLSFIAFPQDKKRLQKCLIKIDIKIGNADITIDKLEGNNIRLVIAQFQNLYQSAITDVDKRSSF